jgi:tRNA pseudouridine13 synthase
MHPPLLKFLPQDFRVSESLALRTAPREDSSHTYLLLQKTGLTTHEALARLAAAFGVPVGDVAAAGLKDEDGVTEQYVSVRALLTPADLERANAAEAGDPDHHLRVSAHGTGTAALETGRLDGNCFRLVVRGLDERAAQVLSRGPQRHNHFFVNYYDTQRFGVPNGPKQTHLIGAALLAGDAAGAFALLRESGSPEGERALLHEGAPEEFWELLDPRVPVFYRCATASYEWNAQVRGLLEEAAPGGSTALEREGVPYAFATSREAVLALLARCPDLPYVRYRWSGGECVRSTADRPTVIQTHVSVGRVVPDEHHAGFFACDLSFFLPSGGYATAAVHQWFHQLLPVGDAAPAGR